jgi:hypothetical protein
MIEYIYMNVEFFEEGKPIRRVYNKKDLKGTNPIYIVVLVTLVIILGLIFIKKRFYSPEAYFRSEEYKEHVRTAH